MCAGLFGQHSHDIVHYNTKNQLGFCEFVVNEISRIQEADKGPINSIIFVKRNIADNSYDQNNLVVITAGNEQYIKTYYETKEDDEIEIY